MAMTPETKLSTPRNDLIRRLGSSTFNYWFGYVANVALVIWMVGHAFAHGTILLPWGKALALAAIGLLSWTLSEYLLHKYVYHVWQSFLSEGHDLHHRRPRDLIGVPWYLTTLAIIVLFRALNSFFGSSSLGIVMGFNWLGYILYCVSHHGSHHWAMGSGRWARMKRHHLIHHAYPDFNWGFTTRFWDRVFGTYAERPPTGARPSGSGSQSPEASR